MNKIVHHSNVFMEICGRWHGYLLVGVILGAVTANPDEFLEYTVAEEALGFGTFGAAFGRVSGLIVGVIQNAASKKHHSSQ